MISDYRFKALACDSTVRSKLEAEMTYFQSLQRVWTQRRIVRMLSRKSDEKEYHSHVW